MALHAGTSLPSLSSHHRPLLTHRSLLTPSPSLNRHLLLALALLLAGANVLLDAAGVCKVTDFGLAAVAPDETAGGWLTAETGTYRWMAPEIIRHERYSRSADIYSFAMICFELVTREDPFADLTPVQAAVASALNDMRPPLPAGVPPAFEALIEACWSASGRDRPTFVQVHKALTELQGGRLSDEDCAWLDAPTGHSVYRGAHGQTTPNLMPSPPRARPATAAVPMGGMSPPQAKTEAPPESQSPQAQQRRHEAQGVGGAADSTSPHGSPRGTRPGLDGFVRGAIVDPVEQVCAVQ